MHRRILSLFLTCFVCVSIFNFGCTKLDTTTLGSDLIPAVDNVNTFADTLLVNATQSIYDDTTYIASISDHVVGSIGPGRDPLFGLTTANIFFQLKPSFYPFYFGHKDSLAGLGLDSVILCLSYKGFWGDSLSTQPLQAYRVEDDVFRDSSKTWRTDDQPNAITAISGIVNVSIPSLANYTIFNNGKDSAKNQIRIKLDQNFANELFNSDTAASGIGNHAFRNDSLFRKVFNGIAVKSPTPGSALMYINLADTNTKLEVHYRIRNAGRIDTVYKSLVLETNGSSSTTSSIKNSKTANFILRDRTGTPSSIPDPNIIYLQAQPGTYASLSIPKLNIFKDTNRIIHRAELIVEQVPFDPSTDKAYVAPNYLYLDLKDTTTSLPQKYKPVYLDLNPGEFYDPDNKVAYFFPSVSGPDFSYYGGYARRRFDGAGNDIVYYNINISRYIQQMVTKHNKNYDLRLYPAYNIHYLQYATYTSYYNSVAFGRVRVGSGSNTTYPMRLRIVYSKVK